MPLVRTSRSFARLSDPALSEFLAGVEAGIAATPMYSTAPVLPPALTLLKTSFDAAIVDASQGGTALTAAKNVVRDQVIDALNKDASFVDIAANGDLASLLLSGYQAVSTNRAQATLPAPQVLSADHGQTGEIRVRVAADSNVKSYLGRIKKATDGDFGPTLSFQSSRKILFQGLTAGVTYVMELCAIGGSTGKSDWSNPVSKMAL
jgi:hypothetical protein